MILNSIDSCFNLKLFNLKDKNIFKADGFVYLEQFLTKRGLGFLRGIFEDNLLNIMRKDFLMQQTGNSPRHMNVIGGNYTNKNSALVKVYKNAKLIEFLSFLTDTDVIECPEIIENIIFTSLTRLGDEHGWHNDDYPFALIVGIESPDENQGGQVEFKDYKGNNRKILLKKGDAYLMRSDIIKHRVSPLKEKATRTILNFTYSIKGNIIIPNGTAYKLCDIQLNSYE